MFNIHVKSVPSKMIACSISLCIWILRVNSNLSGFSHLKGSKQINKKTKLNLNSLTKQCLRAKKVEESNDLKMDTETSKANSKEKQLFRGVDNYNAVATPLLE